MEEMDEMKMEGMEMDEAIVKHLEGLLSQEAGMQQEFPDFTLLSAMDDPMFVRLTSPCVGLSLKDAWCALHWSELAAAAVQKGMAALSRSILSGSARPRELSGGTAALYSVDPRAMSRQQREALKKRIYEAKAEGRKIYPGQ